MTCQYANTDQCGTAVHDHSTRPFTGFEFYMIIGFVVLALAIGAVLRWQAR
jgi:hypothetical protein